MHEIHTAIEIAATAAQRSSVLTDFPAYPSWNPFMRSTTGLPEP